MTIDGTTKIVSIVSVIVGLMLSVAGYFANARFQSLEESINKLNLAEKSMDVSKQAYDVSARLTAEFSLPLARSFAIQYSATVEAMAGGNLSGHKISFPAPALLEEFTSVLGGWKSRKGLMTGKACEQEGLKARQVVTLIIENVGYADAVEVSIKAMEKSSPSDDPTKRWQEVADGKPLWYSILPSGMDGWKSIDYPIGILRGQSSLKDATGPVQVVLASVSGRTDLFGTVLVPLEISWTDNISKQRQTMPILLSQAASLAADLEGAEIGSLGSTCR